MDRYILYILIKDITKKHPKLKDEIVGGSLL